MIRKLLIIGAGGHGRVVADAALAMGDWGEVAFVDDRAPQMGSLLGLQVLGPIAQLATWVGRYTSALVAIGNAAERLRLLEECRALGFDIPVIIHPAAAVSRFATVKEGCVICAQAAVSPGATVQAGSIVNTGATVDHDCQLDEAVHVCPGSHLAGDVRVGARSWIGVGSCVRQGIEIGADATIAAGAVVVSNVPSGATVMGVPARPRSSQ